MRALLMLALLALGACSPWQSNCTQYDAHGGCAIRMD